MYIITSGMNPNEDHIKHYGVLGMRWGEHRYRDKDKGKITARGRSKFNAVKGSNFRQTVHTYMAKRNEARRAHDASKMSKRYEQYAQKETDKTKAKEYAKFSEKYDRIAKEAKKNVKDIESGKLKAGRDFITQFDPSLNLVFVGSNHRTIYNDANRTKEAGKDPSTYSWAIDSYLGPPASIIYGNHLYNKIIES